MKRRGGIGIRARSTKRSYQMRNLGSRTKYSGVPPRSLDKSKRLAAVKYTPDAFHIPYYALNDFQKLKTLDNGGYGTVFTGYDEIGRTGKKRAVAIKIFSKYDEYSEREIQILKTHTYPNIVELFGVIWNGNVYRVKDSSIEKPQYTGYVMEYMELGSLHNEIHDVSKHYDMKLIVLWIEQIGSGLQYLHEHDIIHRDVKPRNILLATRTHLKLADFGLARYISVRNTNTTGQLGTDSYRAPEIVLSSGYGKAADVYSFGVTIWEIICRMYPSENQKFENGCMQLPIDIEEMSEDSWDFVKRCWQRNISDRPSIEEIINFEPKFDQTILVVEVGWHNHKMIIWNRKTSTWTVSRMKIPAHIEVVGVVYLDDELYIIGDRKSFFKLDKNMKWRRLADMNERHGWIKNSCLGWNGYIWVFGVWEKGRLKSVERYDPKKNKWTRMPDMKYARCGAAAAVCNGKIYICGGIGDGGVSLKSVECFDPESGVWTELTDMPTPRSGHFLVCYRNKLVVIGGRNEKQRTTTVLELDPLEKNGQWKELSPLLSPISKSVGVVLDQEIFAIGWGNTNDSADVEIFNGINWRVSPSFPLALEYYHPPPAVLVPQEFADRLSSYPNDLTLLSSVKHTSDGVPYHTLKDFKFKERLGSGGYGTVLKVSELNRFALKKRIVAVKLFKELDVYAEREIQILKTHTHEHIVQLFGVIWDGNVYRVKGSSIEKPIYTGYVMEYIQLGSLHKEIHDLYKSYDIALILLWVKQIGSGLHYLHGNGIIHRDVKPSNILLLRIDHIKLADFGLARNISYQQSCTTGPIGTNVYMAPEVITSKDYGVPADVYSFGVTIWEITQRKDPSKHLKTSTDSSGIVSTELIMDADETYGGLTDLVKRCWQREISARPSIQEIINFEPKFEQTILVMEEGVVNKMTIWNRGTSTWTVSRMEFPDHILPEGVVYLDDELYLITHGKAFFKLDKNMEWRRLADMNEERGWINNSCLEWNGYIWVFGGENWDRREVLKSVERYDPKEDKWTWMPDMKYGRYRAAAAVCNGKIYICGGRGDGSVLLKSVECFDPESGVWTELTDMPTPRVWHCLVCYRNKLVVIGGWDGKEWTTTVLELDPHEKNGQWKELSPLLSPISKSVGVVLDQEIFAIFRNSDEVEIFNGINWRVCLFIIPHALSAVLVPQEFADRLSSYPVDLKQ